jgi:hypothetical protein
MVDIATAEYDAYSRMPKTPNTIPRTPRHVAMDGMRREESAQKRRYQDIDLSHRQMPIPQKNDNLPFPQSVEEQPLPSHASNGWRVTEILPPSNDHASTANRYPDASTFTATGPLSHSSHIPGAEDYRSTNGNHALGRLAVYEEEPHIVSGSPHIPYTAQSPKMYVNQTHMPPQAGTRTALPAPIYQVTEMYLPSHRDQPRRTFDHPQATLDDEENRTVDRLEQESKRRKLTQTVSTRRTMGISIADLSQNRHAASRNSLRASGSKVQSASDPDQAVQRQLANLPRSFQQVFGQTHTGTRSPDHKAVEKQKKTVPPAIESPKQSWRLNTAIKNPPWYTKALAIPTKNDASIAVLCGERILQDRVLRRRLSESGFDLVERDGRIQEADLVLSGTTAVLFRKLMDVLEDLKPLIQSLRIAATYFKRVILIFEVIRFASAEKKEEAAAVDPLGPPIIKALPTLKRGIAVECGVDGKEVIGDIDIVYAANGAEEVASVLKSVTQGEFGGVIKALGRENARGANEQREWLQGEDVGEHHGPVIQADMREEP